MSTNDVLYQLLDKAFSEFCAAASKEHREKFSELYSALYHLKEQMIAGEDISKSLKKIQVDFDVTQST